MYSRASGRHFAALVRIATFSVAATLAAGIGVRGQGQQPAQPSPTFRSSVEFVEVDVVVTNARGEFVRGLTKDDFQVLEDGKRQEVASFTLIDIPIEKFDRPLYATEPIEPDVRT